MVAGGLLLLGLGNSFGSVYTLYTEDGEVVIVIVIVIRRKADAEYRCALSSPSHVDRGE